MKYFIIFLVLIGSSGLISPQVFGDNEFCNIDENMKIQEELIKDDVVLVEFLKVFPHAKLTRANYVDWSNPEQTSMTWTAGVYSLDIHIWGFDQDNPSDCFFPGGYRLNASHLPEMAGLDYHKDPKIVLEQIEELEPEYVKGGPALMLDEKLDPLCGPNTEFVNGVCEVIITEHMRNVPVSSFVDGLFFIIFILPFFVPGALIFIVVSKTPRFSKSVMLAVSIPAIITILYFTSGLILGWYPPGYA
jgi:hypothetical protein